jgi:alpha-1,6-mannosyltransferase
MAEAVAALYERDIEALGAAARARVLRRFTWSRAFQRQMATYHALLGRARVGVPAGEAVETS